VSYKQDDLLITRFLNQEHKNYGKMVEELEFEYNKNGRAVSEV
jgi:hypothetical protein